MIKERQSTLTDSSCILIYLHTYIPTPTEYHKHTHSVITPKYIF